jgi:D-glycero-D-manno-heptose 1,7-bisphosphate phosphatase
MSAAQPDPRRAVFLDRDGVLIRAIVRDRRAYPARSLAEVEILPGVVEACTELHDAGFLLICVTNQPDIARGTTPSETVAEINDHVRAALGLDDVLVCPHDDADNCACRKPRSGMLLEAAERWGIDLSASVMVGDRWRDIEAGRSAGCRTVFVRRGYDEPEPDHPDLIVDEMPMASEWIRFGA